MEIIGIYNNKKVKINWQKPGRDEAGITYLEDYRYKDGMNVVKLSEVEIPESSHKQNIAQPAILKDRYKPLI